MGGPDLCMYTKSSWTLLSQDQRRLLPLQIFAQDRR